jgi:hypothetical protein
MKPHYDYAREQFSLALDCLATGTDTIQQRLYYACDTLINLDKPDEDLPLELRTAFRRMWDSCTQRQPEGGEGTLKATIMQMSDRQAVYCAGVIRDMALVLHQYDIANDPERYNTKEELQFDMPVE